MRLHSEKQARPRRGNLKASDVPCEAQASPSEVAKPSGTPHRWIVIRLAAGERALRANRCAHVKRTRARSARKIGAGVRAGVAFRGPPRADGEAVARRRVDETGDSSHARSVAQQLFQP
jgi:hypothetical protein